MFLRKVRHFTLFLAFIMAFSLLASPIYASNKFGSLPKDAFEVGYSESVECDGVVYSFCYSYDEMGNRVIVASQSNTRIINVVVYNEEASVIYLNGGVLIQLSEEPQAGDISQNPSQTRGWEKIGSFGPTTIQHLVGMTASGLAAVICLAISKYVVIFAAAVILCFGVGVLTYIVTNYKYGLIAGSSYILVPYGNPNQFYTEFTYTTNSGVQYGPYMIGSSG